MEEKFDTKILYMAIRRSFWYGMAFSIGFDMLLQDWLGLEGYIAFVREHWREVHWGVGATIAASGLFLFNSMLGRFYWLKEKDNGSKDTA